MTAEPAPVFSRKFRGYDAAAVDAHIEMLTTKQQLLRGDIESLRARLAQSGEEAAALRNEVSALTETSSSPHAMQQRMAKMLQRAVEDVSQMQAEARSEARELIAAAEAEIEAEQSKHRAQLADLVAQQRALESQCAQTKKELDAELAGMRAEAESALDEARRDAQQEHDELVEHAWQAVDEASQRRIRILEQLMGIYRDLETVPAALQSAYNELNDEGTDTVVSLDGKVRTG